MYQQTLYKIITPVKPHVIKRLNKSRKWKYGYNKEYDIIVISRTGQIGEIYEIQNLVIALPLEDNPYKRSNKKEDQYWEMFEKRSETQTTAGCKEQKRKWKEETILGIIWLCNNM